MHQKSTVRDDGTYPGIEHLRKWLIIKPLTESQRAKARTAAKAAMELEMHNLPFWDPTIGNLWMSTDPGMFLSNMHSGFSPRELKTLNFFCAAVYCRLEPHEQEAGTRMMGHAEAPASRTRRID